MKLGIMQPYFLPYIGYFQLLASVDHFILYDNIKYTKKGWINRNRMLLNGADATFSLPLKKGSDSLNIVQRELAPEFDRRKLLNQFMGTYRKAPQFELVFPAFERIVNYEENNLFWYVYNSIVKLCDYLNIKTEITISSELTVDRKLKGQDKVLALCEAAGATTYVNPVGGTELYSKTSFRERNIELQFIKTTPIEYMQFGAAFVPWLSIIDVLMFNPLNTVRNHIHNNYDLI